MHQSLKRTQLTNSCGHDIWSILVQRHFCIEPVLQSTRDNELYRSFQARREFPSGPSQAMIHLGRVALLVSLGVPMTNKPSESLGRENLVVE